MKLRTQILIFLLVFALTPLIFQVGFNLPLVLERIELFYQKAYLLNLRADFRDLDQHLASRHEMIRLLAKLPEPGLILGEGDNDDQIDLARARYTQWINQVLREQLDITQILFLDPLGNDRFWLERDAKTQQWRPTTEAPERPSQRFLEATANMKPGAVMVSRIRINPQAGSSDPRHLMTLYLITGIAAPEQPANLLGTVVMSIDVGGLAQFYRNTLWVTNDGSYLLPGRPLSESREAFEDFTGLKQIFIQGKPALWKGEEGEQFFWVPMFLTEDHVPLWVGRPVNPSPIASFRNELVLRVIGVVFVLIVAVMIMARWFAVRLERFGRLLTEGLGQVLQNNQPVRFAWRGPREVRALGDQLTALAEAHAEHVNTLREHARELEKSNQYKTEFLANVSHELRTPLNSILLLSKMLADGQTGLRGEQQRQAQVIHEAGTDLKTMIDNILDISRIEVRQVTVNLEWVDLELLLEETLELVRPQFTAKGLYLNLEFAPHVTTRIYSDREKLRQILKNFLSNAVKFTHQGGVTVRVDTSEQKACPLRISVQDTGIGIPANKQDIIFEAFKQADGSTRRRYGGTGLGLSISRELSHLLGGCIDLESGVGRGSCFSLLLPLEFDDSRLDEAQITREDETEQLLLPELEPSPAPTAVFSGHCVLLVERDVQNLVSLTQQLEPLGLRVLAAADAEEAVDTLREEEPCSLVLIDAMMPDDEACDTIKLIRDEDTCRELPIFVMGDGAMEVRRPAYLEAGADGFLVKPVAAEILRQTIEQHLEMPAPESKQLP